MSLDDAIAVAREVEDCEEFTLVAIGRFVPREQMADSNEWGCSVLPVSTSAERPVILWSRDDWKRLGESVIGRQSFEEPRRDQKHRQQLSLF
jgi:hypothetical protein